MDEDARNMKLQVLYVAKPCKQLFNIERLKAPWVLDEFVWEDTEVAPIFDFLLL